MKIARQRASSLITTLLVLVVLSTIVVAFMQSMSVERMTARSSKNLLQAELTAKAGASAAKAQVLRLFSKYPDSITLWQPVVNGLITEGTVFYFRGQNLPVTSLSTLNLPVATNGAAFNPTPGNPTAVQIYAWPLISGAVPTIGSTIAGVTNAFPNAFSVANSTDLNANNWVGTAPGQLKKSIRAQWVYVTNSDGVTNARYAYWVEDESFKVNVVTATNVVRGGTSLGTNAQEIPLQGVLANAVGISSVDTAASEIVELRNRFGGTNIPTFGTISQLFSLAGTNAVGEQLKFISTEYSSGLNLSRGGWKRVNINNVFDSSLPVATQLNRFMAAVTNSSAAPLFGQRFYRSSATAAALNVTNLVTLTNSMVYLNKIAANVKDYIDTDSQPTLINLDFAVRPSGEPTEALEPVGGGLTGPNPVIAFGKENVPMLQEYAIQGRLLSMVPAGWSNSNPGGANFECTLDHYFEFYNMGTKDITAADLGTNPFILVYNQMAANNTTPQIREGRPFKINLAAIPGLVFQAGKTTVITTDPSPNPSLIASGAKVFSAPVEDAARRFSGRTTDSYSNRVYDSGGGIVFNNSFRVRFQTRTNSLNDYETCMVLGNSEGIIESFPALPIVRSSSQAMDLVADRPVKINSNAYFTRGGSLMGNSSTSATTVSPASGDPRSLNEQMTFVLYNTAVPTEEATRFLWSNLDDNAVPASSSLGALNKNFVKSANWPDYTSDAASGSDDAPMVITNEPMRTIGELGHIYDPARLVTPSYRGGGRTLHIGQPEAFSSTTNVSGLWDGATDSASRTWAAWRLADFFDVSTNSVSSGLININGVRRDNGLALKAALKGYAYQSGDNSEPSVKGISLTDAQLNELVSAMTNRLANSNPFWERGEFSEMGLFQNGTTLSGKNMAQVLDRGREELSRRMMNLVTTKGNTFTAYAVGQAISVGSNGGIKILATARSKQTFQVMPNGIDAQVDAFDPASGTDMQARFAPLTNYFLKSVWNSQE